LGKNFEQEKIERVDKETQMLKKLAQEAENIAKLIEKHKAERIQRMSEIKEECKDEQKLQNHYIKGFEGKATEKFKKLRINIEDEMSCRFKHQDEVIDNLQKVIRQFQGTLKVFGKNV